MIVVIDLGVQCRVVGWYHSHPTFATFPSMIDIANQVTQQNAHKTCACEPYIAAIVGPYNKKLPTCQSSITWFYVNHEPGRIPAEDENPLQAGCTPMQLQVCLHAFASSYTEAQPGALAWAQRIVSVTKSQVLSCGHLTLNPLHV